MAKKHRESAVVVFEKYLEYLYQNGILHSFIANSSIILILSLIVSNYSNSNKPIIISLSTAETVTDFIDDKSIFIDMASASLENNDSSNSSEVIVNIPESKSTEYEISVPEIDNTTRHTSETFQNKDLMIDLAKVKPTKSNTNTVSSIQNGNSNTSGKGQQTLKRLEEAGAKTGDVQVSIAWDNYNDIDLWVVLENQYGEFVVNWVNRIGPGNGMLDVDRNVNPTTKEAVENIFWHHGFAPEGKYTVFVQHYWQWDKQDSTPVFLRILVDGKVTEKMISVSRYQGVKKVYSFYRKIPQKNQNYSPETSGSIGPHFPIGQLWSGQ